MNLDSFTIKILKDLHKDIEEILKADSNINVIWKLEDLHNNKAFLKSADIIRKHLNSTNI